MATAAISSCVSETESEVMIQDQQEEDNVKIRVNYEAFFVLQNSPPDVPSKCLAKCKLCHNPYKYTLNSKGNLLKHLQISHPKNLHDYKVERSKQVPSYQHTLNKDGSMLQT